MLCDDLDGWDGGGGWVGGPKGEIYVYIYLIHSVIQQKLTRHCKAIILQFKKKIIQAQKKNYLLLLLHLLHLMRGCHAGVALCLSF